MDEHASSSAGPSQVHVTQQQVDTSLSSVIQEITSTTNLPFLARSLAKFATKDLRDAILSSLLPGNQDPLEVLDMETNTLGIVWIL
jgi:COP9 signalosome complex subunit 3